MTSMEEPQTTETPTEALTESSKYFSISDYAGTFYPVDSNLHIYIIMKSQSEGSTDIEISISNGNYTHVSEVVFTGNIDVNPFTFEAEDGFGRNRYTLDFKDGKIYLTAKCIEFYDIWAIPELNQVEMIHV